MAPLLTAFAQEVFDTAERIAVPRPGRRLDPPLLGLLDEARRPASPLSRGCRRCWPTAWRLGLLLFPPFSPSPQP
jgi:hypothetical protein